MAALFSRLCFLTHNNRNSRCGHPGTECEALGRRAVSEYRLVSNLECYRILSFRISILIPMSLNTASGMNNTRWEVEMIEKKRSSPTKERERTKSDVCLRYTDNENIQQSAVLSSDNACALVQDYIGARDKSRLARDFGELRDYIPTTRSSRRKTRL